MKRQHYYDGIILGIFPFAIVKIIKRPTVSIKFMSL